jgi:hypothetical protein
MHYSRMTAYSDSVSTFLYAGCMAASQPPADRPARLLN